MWDRKIRTVNTMPPEREFELNSVSTESRPDDYHRQILKIIEGKRASVRVVEPDELLHRELHEQRIVDARKEIAEYEPVRRDVCETFGVSFDEEHIYIHDHFSTATKTIKSQRSLRAFFVLIDLYSKQTFYGEGRIDHNTLFKGVCGKGRQFVPDMDFDSVLESLDGPEKRYLVFKGFLSTKDFHEVSEASRSVLETPLLDEKGQKIETAEDWFLTGHNLD